MNPGVGRHHILALWPSLSRYLLGRLALTPASLAAGESRAHGLPDSDVAAMALRASRGPTQGLIYPYGHGKRMRVSGRLGL